MRRFKYSLTTLALLVVVIGLALAVVVSNMRNKRLTAENESLRDRLHDAVEPNQLYWRRLPKPGGLEWEYRIYLPAIHPHDSWKLLAVHPGGERLFYFKSGMCSVRIAPDPSRPGNGDRIINLTVDHVWGNPSETERLAMTLDAEAVERLGVAHRLRNVAHGWEFKTTPDDTLELLKTDDLQVLIRLEKGQRPSD